MRNETNRDLKSALAQEGSATIAKPEGTQLTDEQLQQVAGGAQVDFRTQPR